MNASYGARLALICFAGYFVGNLSLTMALRVALPLLLRAVRNMRAATASWLLFCARVAPGVLSLGLVLAFCVPSYLWLEPGRAAERITTAGLLIASCGLALLASAVVAAGAALRRSRLYLRHARTSCSHLRGEVVMVDSERPLFALAGLLRPRLVISSELAESLTPGQFEMAVRHERAHEEACDNLRKLVMLLSPLALPFSRGFAVLDREIAKFTEWAADDRAIAGDPEKAITLADALVRVARMEGTCGVQSQALVSTLVSEDCSLDHRVLRLLDLQQPPEPVRNYGKLLLAAAVLAATCLFWIRLPSALSVVHAALEQLFG